MFQGGGNYAPSFKFAQVGDTVSGEILSVEQQDQTSMKDGQPILDKRGQVKKQLQIILQTTLTNWQNVAKVPTDRDTQQPLPGSQDDGRRAIYVKGWMIGAVGDAVEKATGQRGAPRVGGKLAVRHSGTRPSSQPQPIKLYEAKYQAPANVAQDDMFSSAPQQQAPAPQQASPWEQQAPAPQQQAPAQQADPWASDNFGDEPPF